MAKGMTIHTACFAASIAAAVAAELIAPACAGNARGEAVPARSPASIQVAASEAGSHFVPLGIGKSVVIDLPRDVKDVLVADPKTANAVIRSARRAYLIGVAVGQTSVFFFDAEGKQIAGFDIAVTRDLNGVRAALKQMFPHSDMRIEGVGDGVVLSGSAATPAEAQQAVDIASRLAGDGKVVNGLVVKDRDQVMLKVTVAEVQRDVIKQLGVNLDGSVGFGSAVLNFNTRNPFSANGSPLSGTAISPGFMGTPNPVPNPGGFPFANSSILPFRNSVQATVQAMERAGVIRTLAEPNITAISGESATFLVGGEFPFVTGTSGPPSYSPSIEFKKFGVSLNFTPVVLSEGRLSLKVLTEVSELSTEGSLQAAGYTVPSLKTRRADTTVEIPSGGALAMAGMIKEQTKQAINGFPGLMEVPVLGALFKSRDFVNNQTELVIIVTPYVVRAVAQKALSRPDDGFADAPDPATILLGRLNQIYGITGRTDPRQTYHGKYGFILD